MTAIVTISVPVIQRLIIIVLLGSRLCDSLRCFNHMEDIGNEISPRDLGNSLECGLDEVCLFEWELKTDLPSPRHHGLDGINLACKPPETKESRENCIDLRTEYFHDHMLTLTDVESLELCKQNAEEVIGAFYWSYSSDRDCRIYGPGTLYEVNSSVDNSISGVAQCTLLPETKFPNACIGKNVSISSGSPQEVIASRDGFSYASGPRACQMLCKKNIEMHCSSWRYFHGTGLNCHFLSTDLYPLEGRDFVGYATGPMSCGMETGNRIKWCTRSGHKFATHGEFGGVVNRLNVSSPALCLEECVLNRRCRYWDFVKDVQRCTLYKKALPQESNKFAILGSRECPRTPGKYDCLANKVSFRCAKKSEVLAAHASKCPSLGMLTPVLFNATRKAMEMYKDLIGDQSLSEVTKVVMENCLPDPDKEGLKGFDCSGVLEWAFAHINRGNSNYMCWCDNEDNCNGMGFLEPPRTTKKQTTTTSVTEEATTESSAANIFGSLLHTFVLYIIVK